VKENADEFSGIGTKLQILTLKRENIKLRKRMAKLEAENVTLQNRIKVLKKELMRYFHLLPAELLLTSI